ncbi:MAG TPA: LLM class flavin-dependent oxidoreductase [Stellaceae bacterium]|nr:LLM class flavin-dependent oxidoreductase [Stellaceae bacterium]
MAEASRPDQLRQAQNPLFSSRKLKLGTFSSNLSHGCAISKIEGTLKAEWPSTAELARMGDEMDFEALVPVGRWKGFGGTTNFNGAGFESYTWAAGIGALTKKSGVFATSHVPTVHPVMAAKQATTIDHITNGRFSLNVVTGWFQPEIEMFGEPQQDHDLRYERAAEWLEIIKLLWTREEEFDFDGRFYRIKGGWLQPKPVQKPYPVVMNAGGSDKGREFVARYCDVAFTALVSHEPDAMAAQAQAYKRAAWDARRVDLPVWTNAYIIQGETEAEARKFLHHYIHEQGDWEACDNLVRQLGINSETFPADALRELKVHFIGGWAGYQIVGTKEQVVEGLARLAKAGFDGVILSWARYVEGMREFQATTYPLLVQAGLR